MSNENPTPATKALDPDPFPCRSLRHAVYAALLHFGRKRVFIRVVMFSAIAPQYPPKCLVSSDKVKTITNARARGLRAEPAIGRVSPGFLNGHRLGTGRPVLRF
jgi:hypothetical protein